VTPRNLGDAGIGGGRGGNGFSLGARLVPSGTILFFGFFFSCDNKTRQ